jgi:hypothetical protein
MIKLDSELSERIKNELQIHCVSKDNRIDIHLNQEDVIKILPSLHKKGIFIYCWVGPSPQGRNDKTDYSSYSRTAELSSNATYDDVMKHVKQIIREVKAYRHSLYLQIPDIL